MGDARWLPNGKIAAVCFSVDDIHPARSEDGYDAGGDLGQGALGRVQRLLERHQMLHATLMVTPDWRPARLVSEGLLARLPGINRRIYHVRRHRDGRFRLDRHPHFVRYLNDLPRTEIVLHGLHHVHRGPRLAVEFQEQSVAECETAIREGLSIFRSAGLRFAMGFSPPGWNLPRSLARALARLGFSFVGSARDLVSAIEPGVSSMMSGLKHVPLIEPALVSDTRVVHLPTNFQATSPVERAHQIIACNGLLSVKAHIFKTGGGHTMADGLDEAYFRVLDRLFHTLEDRYGESLWWTSMEGIARCFRESRRTTLDFGCEEKVGSPREESARQPARP